MSIQVLFRVTIKNPDSKDAIASEMTTLNLLPYSVKKLGEDDPDTLRVCRYSQILMRPR